MSHWRVGLVLIIHNHNLVHQCETPKEALEYCQANSIEGAFIVDVAHIYTSNLTPESKYILVELDTSEYIEEL